MKRLKLPNIMFSFRFFLYTLLYSFSTSSEFCSLPVTFTSSLDPVQAQQNAGPELDPNCLTFLNVQPDLDQTGTLMITLIYFFGKVVIKICADN